MFSTINLMTEALKIDKMWSYLSSSMYNATLVFFLRSCEKPPQTTFAHVAEDIESSDHENDFDLSFLNEGLNWLFGETSQDRDGLSTIYLDGGHDESQCEDIIHTTLSGSVSLVTVAGFLLALVGMCIAILTVRQLWKKENLTIEKPGDDGGETVIRNTTDTHPDFDVDTVGASGSEENITGTAGSPVLKKSNVLTVISITNCKVSNLKAKVDSVQFLTCTIDHLCTELDWILGFAAADRQSPADIPMSATTTSLLTPRLQRKAINRSTWRTLTSLPLAASLPTDGKEVLWMWQKVAEMSRRMNWKHLDMGDLDVSAVQDSNLGAVLQFYQQTCPVRVDQWNASCLIVNYVLTLLEQELHATSYERDSLNVIELRSFGSAANETCIGRANRFNVMLVMQLPFTGDMTIYDCGTCDEVPAGKMVLGVKQSSALGRDSSFLLRKDHFGDTFGSFLSAREVVKALQRLMSNTLDRLKLKSKLLLDRLSFSMYLSQYHDLLLCIDTKKLGGLGLGLSEITVRLTPALSVSSQESDPLPPLYAVPPWNSNFTDMPDVVRGRLQSRILRSRNQEVPPDLLWQFNCSELSKSVMASAKNRLASASVSGCQVMCQQILRALFSHSGKDTLLTTGEIHPHILDSVVFFLLLESPTSSWNLSCLPDRFSDCVHFLKSAVQSAWMPAFMIHNPHLLKQMPALQLMPLLATGRQENILSNLGPDAIDSILSFMDCRLQETGLRRCVKAEFSTEMWEYEFFIFG